MNYLTIQEINQKEKSLLETAKSIAKRSFSKNGHYVGCAILAKSGNIYTGATISHSRIVGSTCAERMAVDQIILNQEEPIVCVIVGKLNRTKWGKNSLCTPCGCCLEMLWELQMHANLENIDLLCSNWDLNRILQTKLSELFPRFEAVKR